MRAVAHFDETEEVETPSMDDLNKTFRTRFLTIWLLMNAILYVASSPFVTFLLTLRWCSCLTITRLGSNIQTRYFQVILWITFGLATVRFLGFMWYLTGESSEFILPPFVRKVFR